MRTSGYSYPGAVFRLIGYRRRCGTSTCNGCNPEWIFLCFWCTAAARILPKPGGRLPLMSARCCFTRLGHKVPGPFQAKTGFLLFDMISHWSPITSLSFALAPLQCMFSPCLVRGSLVLMSL